MDWSNVLERAGWTSLQAAIAAVPVTQVTLAITGGDIDTLTQLGLAALGAAVGAALSFVKTVAQERMEVLRGRHEA